jgi:hypothetical protein
MNMIYHRTGHSDPQMLLAFQLHGGHDHCLLAIHGLFFVSADTEIPYFMLTCINTWMHIILGAQFSVGWLAPGIVYACYTGVTAGQYVPHTTIHGRRTAPLTTCESTSFAFAVLGALIRVLCATKNPRTSQTALLTVGRAARTPSLL